MDMGISSYPIFDPSLAIYCIFQSELQGKKCFFIVLTLNIHQLELNYWLVFKSSTLRARMIKVITHAQSI